MTTIAIIGAGTVGSTAAYSLLLRNIASKIILVDTQEPLCKGQVADLSDALPFSSTTSIVAGTLRDAGMADIAIITAGAPQKPGQSRRELLPINSKIIRAIIDQMRPLNPALIIIMVTNPTDILTLQAQEFSGLPKNQVFGSGTLLDAQRLKYEIGQKINVAPSSINLTIIGEHGDSQVVPWSHTFVEGSPLIGFKGIQQAALEEMALTAKHKAYDIIACKGSTAFGIATCIAEYCFHIVNNTRTVIPVSCFVEKFGICLSMPALLGKNGIEDILMPPLNAEEEHQLQNSVDELKSLLKP